MNKKCLEIIENHKEDESQQEVLKSNKKRLIIEAPAGYGKTTVLISKIKLWLLDEKFNRNKIILCLSYSVSASYKIKNDIEKEIESEFNKNVRVGNYHKIAFHILKKFGYLINGNLSKEVFENEKIRIIDDKNLKDKLKNVELKYSDIEEYNKFIIDKLLDKNILTYDSILTLAIKILKEFKEVNKFYKKYISHIVVDEFQDSNILHYEFLKMFISNKQNIAIFGDSIQRIYGFLGAVPKIMEKAGNELGLSRIELEKNHRFNNEDLKKLDKNIRQYILSKLEKESYEIEKPLPRIGLIRAKNTEEQAKKINRLVKKFKDKKVAILFKSNNYNSKVLKSKFKFKYFDGMYDKNELKKFESSCYKLFDEKYSSSLFKKDSIDKFKNEMSYEYPFNSNNKSIFMLLDAFLNYITSIRKNSKFRNEIIKETFYNNHLKDYINYIYEDNFITTIHSSKGLNWDYVILADLAEGLFPNNYYIKSKQDEINELCVFYVAATRAKDNLYFSYTDKFYRKASRLIEGKMSRFINKEYLDIKEINL